MAFRLSECLHTPAFSGKLLFRLSHIVGDAPVRTHDAVVAKPFAEQIVYDIFAEGIPYIFTAGLVCAERNRVVRHHGAGRLRTAVQREGSLRKGP